MKFGKTSKVNLHNINLTVLGSIVAFISVLNSPTFSQTRIKERIELIPQKDTTEVFSNVNCSFYNWIEIELVNSILPPDEYGEPTTFFGQIYDVKLISVHSYCVTNNGETTREITKFDFDSSQTFTVYTSMMGFDTYIITGKDTINSSNGISGIRQNFRIFTKEDARFDSLETTLCITTSKGTLSYDGRLSFKIKHSPLKVSLNPENISPGDTALIKLEIWDNNSKTYTPLSAGQDFEIGLQEGCGNGDVLTCDGVRNHYYRGNYGNDCYLKFIAADSLSTDSTSALLRVGIPEPAPRQMIVPETKQKASLMKQNMLNHYKSLLKMFNNDKKFLGLADSLKKTILSQVKLKEAKVLTSGGTCSQFNFYFYSLCPLIIQSKPEIILISPTKDKNETITAEPKMPTVICSARLKNYTGGQVNYYWEYCVSYNFPRFKDNIDKKTKKPYRTYYPPRTGKSIFKGVSTAYNCGTTVWEVPFKKSNNEFAFQGRYYKTVKGTTYGPYERIDDWTEGEDVFTGGYVYLKLTVRSLDGKVIASYQQNINQLLGENPPNSNIVFEMVSKEFQAILMKESKTNQFNNSNWRIINGITYNKKGFSIWGPPTGFGLVQLDFPPATELQLWNWKMNIIGGISLYKKKEIMANNYLNQYAPTREQLQMDIFQLYNGFHYWIWDEKNETLKVNPQIIPNDKTKSPYAEEVWNIYTTIIN